MPVKAGAASLDTYGIMFACEAAHFGFYPCPHCIVGAVCFSQHAHVLSPYPHLSFTFFSQTHSLGLLVPRLTFSFLTHSGKKARSAVSSPSEVSVFSKTSKKRSQISFICSHYTQEHLANYFISSKIKMFPLLK